MCCRGNEEGQAGDSSASGPQGRHENIAMERAEFQKVVEKKYMKHRAHMRRRFCSKIWVDS